MAAATCTPGCPLLRKRFKLFSEFSTTPPSECTTTAPACIPEPHGLAAMGDATLHWWLALCGVAALNIVAWMSSALVLRRQGSPAPGDPHRLQLLLSAGYVFGCAYRSWLPVYDIQRLCL